MKSRLGLAALAVAFLGCGGGQKTEAAAPNPAETAAQPPAVAEPAPVPPVESQAAPASLLATMVVPAPEAAVERLAAFANAVEPGAGAMLQPQMISQVLGMLFGVPTLDGLDMQQTMYLLVFDPRSSSMPYVLVAALADQDALERAVAQTSGVELRMHEGYAAIGRSAEIGTAANYALTQLRAEPVPEQPTLTVRMEPVMATYGAEIAMARGMMSAAMANEDGATKEAVALYVDGVFSLLGQIEIAKLAVELGGEGVQLALELDGKADTALAQFVQAQQPSDFALLTRLPVPGAPMVMGGNLQMGPLADFFVRFNELVGSGAGEASAAVWSEMATAVQGPFAAGFDFGGDRFQFAMIVQAAKPEAARELVREGFAKASPTGYVRYRKVGTPSFRVKGVPVDEYRMSVDLKKAPEEMREQLAKVYGKRGLSMMYAVVGDYLLMAGGADARKHMQSLIATANSGEAADAGFGNRPLSQAIEAARARNDSVLMFIDFGAFLPQAAGGGFVMTAGTATDALVLRVQMTTEQLRAAAAGGAAAP